MRIRTGFLSAIALTICVEAALVLLATTSCLADSGILVIEKRTSQSGMDYTVFDTTSLDSAFCIKRPSLKKDASIKLCVPAAFTTQEDAISGIYMCDGTLNNRRAIDKGLGGALIIVNGAARIVDTTSGARLDDDKLLGQLQEMRASLFQQFLLVHQGKPSSYKDKTKFQRRALVQFANRQAVIESEREMTLSEFAKELAEDFEAKEALYADMGAWDEGWYVDPSGETRKIGDDRSLTGRQTNWLAFRAAPKGATAQKFPEDIEQMLGESPSNSTTARESPFPFSHAQYWHYARIALVGLGSGLLVRQSLKFKAKTVNWRIFVIGLLLSVIGAAM